MHGPGVRTPVMCDGSGGNARGDGTMGLKLLMLIVPMVVAADPPHHLRGFCTGLLDLALKSMWHLAGIAGITPPTVTVSATRWQQRRSEHANGVRRTSASRGSQACWQDPRSLGSHPAGPAVASGEPSLLAGSRPAVPPAAPCCLALPVIGKLRPVTATSATTRRLLATWWVVHDPRRLCCLHRKHGCGLVTVLLWQVDRPLATIKAPAAGQVHL